MSNYVRFFVGAAFTTAARREWEGTQALPYRTGEFTAEARREREGTQALPYGTGEFTAEAQRRARTPSFILPCKRGSVSIKNSRREHT